MLYLETDFDTISEKINEINGRMTEGALNPELITFDLKRTLTIGLKNVTENQFIGSTVTLRSRFGHFPTRYKYRVKGVAATFKYTKKGWAFVSCQRTEDYPDQTLPEWIIGWSTKAREALEKKAKRAYEESLQRAISIQG